MEYDKGAMFNRIGKFKLKKDILLWRGITASFPESSY
jgi:hypothetical protein